jgi:cytochrome subunit of sulfide dehydrogenase
LLWLSANGSDQRIETAHRLCGLNQRMGERTMLRSCRRNGIRAALAMATACALAGGASVAFAQDTTTGRHLAQTCTNCHGTNGVSIAGMPSLAGQDREYLARQMRDFRDGKRPATVMHQLAKGFTDPEIDALAAWFAARKFPVSK